MSEDAPIARAQNQDASTSANNEEHPRPRASGNPLQIETIKVLNDILANFMSQCTSMHNSCRLITAILEENPSLTAEQCTEAYNMYRNHLEEAYASRMRVI